MIRILDIAWRTDVEILNNYTSFHKMNECPVCLEILWGQCIVETPCHHRFCLSCVLKWTKAECPLCRRVFSLKEMPMEMVHLFKKNSGRPPPPPSPLPTPAPRQPSTSIPNVSSVVEFPYLS
jgi:hypothetical protein